MADEFNPETASLEELRARSEAEQPTEPEQKRNADGTFAAAPKTETPTDIDPPEEKTLYQRRIDLGDGSGVQVFTADSLEELVDKLTDAQINATKKIREQQAELGKVKPQSRATERTADEEFILSQELMTKPSKAIAKLFEETVGMPITEFKSSVQRVKAFEEGQAGQKAQQDFVNQTPEYFANKVNGTKIISYLQTYKLPVTVESMTKAFTELNAAGLLQVKPTETPTEAKTDPNPAPTEQRRRSSGLNNRNSATPVVKTGPTEEELYSMPLDKLKELSLAAAREQN